MEAVDAEEIGQAPRRGLVTPQGEAPPGPLAQSTHVAWVDAPADAKRAVEEAQQQALHEVPVRESGRAAASA